MRDRNDLVAELRRLDGRPYPAYKDLTGPWRLGDAVLHLDRVQGDPFAAPTRIRLIQPTRVPEAILADADRRLAAEDWLLRQVGEHAHGSRRGSGGSGRIDIHRPGPEVVERSAVRLHDDGRVELRMAVGLPAKGRRILGRQAEALLLGDLLEATSWADAGPGLDAHCDSVGRQRALRRALASAGLVAFVEDGAVLPRRSGVDPRPLPDAVPFAAPSSMRVTLSTPEGDATGLGVAEGVTLITGGGFHGKSTLLDALEHGVMDHVPGDGREGVVCRAHAMRVRAEDGRRVAGVDISPFLGTLPGDRSTEAFVTEDASGSTSQAAALVEAVESGSRVLLIDEDTSATNLLVRDARMRQLIPDDREPITPLVSRVRQLHESWGVSTVMVVGGVGDYLAVADAVIAMDAYVPEDVTARAHALAGSVPPAPDGLAPVVPRVFSPQGLTPRKIKARSPRAVRFGKEELDLTGVSLVLDAAMARSLALTLRFLAAEGFLDGRRALDAALDALEAVLDDEGIEAISRFDAPPGDLIRPRRQEVVAALSRLRTARLA